MERMGAVIYTLPNLQLAAKLIVQGETMKRYTFGCCDTGSAADSRDSYKDHVPSITKQVNEAGKTSEKIKSIS
jgi:hypothetical protein